MRRFKTRAKQLSREIVDATTDGDYLSVYRHWDDLLHMADHIEEYMSADASNAQIGEAADYIDTLIDQLETEGFGL